ncbi:MAG: PepSY domain-containing protein [Oscillospiraceae bacterium]|nr:PepSY domain-containing protein [Oscillospiraceae bacterium]
MKKNFSKRIAAAVTALVLSLMLSICAVAAPSASITPDEAKQAALDHAQLTAEQVVFTQAKLDYDDGRAVYDIEFYSGNKEYDYEIDANSGKVLEFDYDIENFDISSVQVKLSLDEAKAVALKNAKLSENDVVFTKAKLDYDDGRAVYDIEFYSGNKEYDYEIDANTGKILDRDIEYKVSFFSRIVDFFKNMFSGKSGTVSTPPAAADVTVEATSTASQEKPAASNRITLEEAKKVALDDAKLTAADVTFTKAKLDYDDGRAVYDIEFYSGAKEYDYEIDAATGRILEKDIDINDDVNAPTEGQDSQTYITAEQAKAAALSAAGFSASEVRGLKAEFDFDDGRAVYEVEFKKGIFEYDYEIDAVSGKVLKAEKEAD